MNKTITLRLSPELLRTLKTMARTHQRSMAGQLRWLIINAESHTEIALGAVDQEESSLVKPGNYVEKMNLVG